MRKQKNLNRIWAIICL